MCQTGPKFSFLSEELAVNKRTFWITSSGFSSALKWQSSQATPASARWEAHSLNKKFGPEGLTCILYAFLTRVSYDWWTYAMD